MGTAFGSVADDDGKKQKRAAAKGAAGGLNKGRLVGHGGETFWSGGEWISCKDGKFRAVEPGIFPLALGVSRGVVPSGDPGESYANEVGEARGMRLKGYGNAIVPQLAALFVRAFLEAEND